MGYRPPGSTEEDIKNLVQLGDLENVDVTTPQEGDIIQWNNGASRWQNGPIPSASAILNVTTVTTATYSVLTTDEYIGVNFSGPVTLTLPSGAVDGKNWFIKDVSGAAKTNNITINTAGSETIDNNNGVVMAINNMSLTIIFNNGNFNII